jgi:hypothetical protein
MENKIMTAFDDLKTDFESYRDEVKADVATLVTKIDALIVAAANNGIDPRALAALTAEIDAAKADLNASVATPPTPAPVPITPSSVPGNPPPVPDPNPTPTPTTPAQTVTVP